ncbi:DUF4338 domain-containing protein [Acidithiobacillus ferrooxidans]|nr:Druantia anti-phage system protein DruA [Acidithiobacillus ferrooxidans]MBU2774393.1 DUF4338 domain-containing protein [Acidithiobacillus ferrooxidans]
MEASTLTSHQQASLHRIEVRPILPTERERWNTLMQAHHYRGFRTMAGRTLRYVATLDDRWVALLGWQAAAYQCQAREQWIGWSWVLRRQRLHLIANNARFLILPRESFPNLASRILSLNLRRLSADWQSVYGHPIVLAETFVESPRFTGACYRAANWVDVGWTKGFARRPGAGYVYHGQPKRLLLYPLHPQARIWLAQPQPQSEWTKTPMQTVTLSDAQMEGLRQIFFRLPDARSRLGKQHPLPAILTIAVAAVLTQAQSYIAMAEWAARLTQAQLKRIRARFNPRTQRYVAPSEPTLRRVLQGANVTALDAAIGAWLLGIAGLKPWLSMAKCSKARFGKMGPRSISSALSCTAREPPLHKKKSPGKPTKSRSCAACSKTSTSRTRSSPPMLCIPSERPLDSSLKTKRPIISSPPSKAISENSATA